MQRSSYIGMVVSTGFFLTAGAVGFWPGVMPMARPYEMATLGMQPFEAARDSKSFTVFRREMERAEIEKTVALRSPASPFDTEVRITLARNNTPIAEILAQLFKQAGQEYVIDSRIHGGRTSIDLQNLPFQYALLTVLRASPLPVTCRRHQGRGVYTVQLESGGTPRKPGRDDTGSVSAASLF